MVERRFSNLVGWLPAVIFPAGSIIQLVDLHRSTSAAGVSATSWLLFAVANVAMYFYTEKYSSPQSVALLFNAVLQVAIAALALGK